MMDAARAHGMATLQQLATAIGSTYANVRTINSRGTIPASVQAKIDALPRPGKSK